MENLDIIEKLYELKEKGIISEADFIQKKAKALQQIHGEKSQLAYVLLAFFLGIFGVHNFYAGRWKRGLAQLLITILTFFVGIIITHLWAVINIFTIHTDGKGQEFEPCKPAKYVCGILGIFGYIYTILCVFIVIIAGIAGYSGAMAKYRSRELVEYASQVAVLTLAQNAGDGITSPANCESVGLATPKFFTGKCTVYPGGKVKFSNIDNALKRQLIKRHKIKEDLSGNLIFSY